MPFQLPNQQHQSTEGTVTKLEAFTSVTLSVCLYFRRKTFWAVLISSMLGLGCYSWCGSDIARLWSAKMRPLAANIVCAWSLVTNIALQKRRNQSRFHLGCGLGWAEGTMYLVGTRIPLRGGGNLGDATVKTLWSVFVVAAVVFDLWSHFTHAMLCWHGY